MMFFTKVSFIAAGVLSIYLAIANMAHVIPALLQPIH